MTGSTIINLLSEQLRFSNITYTQNDTLSTILEYMPTLNTHTHKCYCLLIFYSVIWYELFLINQYSSFVLKLISAYLPEQKLVDYRQAYHDHELKAKTNKKLRKAILEANSKMAGAIDHCALREPFPRIHASEVQHPESDMSIPYVRKNLVNQRSSLLFQSPAKSANKKSKNTKAAEEHGLANRNMCYEDQSIQDSIDQSSMVSMSNTQKPSEPEQSNLLKNHNIDRSRGFPQIKRKKTPSEETKEAMENEEQFQQPRSRSKKGSKAKTVVEEDRLQPPSTVQSPMLRENNYESVEDENNQVEATSIMDIEVTTSNVVELLETGIIQKIDQVQREQVRKSMLQNLDDLRNKIIKKLLVRYGFETEGPKIYIQHEDSESQEHIEPLTLSENTPNTSPPVETQMEVEAELEPELHSKDHEEEEPGSITPDSVEDKEVLEQPVEKKAGAKRGRKKKIVHAKKGCRFGTKSPRRAPWFKKKSKDSAEQDESHQSAGQEYGEEATKFVSSRIQCTERECVRKLYGILRQRIGTVEEAQCTSLKLFASLKREIIAMDGSRAKRINAYYNNFESLLRSLCVTSTSCSLVSKDQDFLYGNADHCLSKQDEMNIANTATSACTQS